MGKIDKTKIVIKDTPLRYSIPEPPEKNFFTGLVFLAASFFNNTDALDIEHVTKNSQFAIRYRGAGYEERKRRRK